MAQADQAFWLATANVARFREMLLSPRDGFQRKQLEELLASELERLNALSPDRAIAASGPSESTKSPGLPESPRKPGA
ncbi:MAG TPA: hypothetical protein VG821_01255 [Rhizomicrobium sp.]|nr:hypothetical protein [Rhizomicrobium sp.]